ncbi:MAG: thioredoxin family protein [Melioribacteraceae bacterium]
MANQFFIDKRVHNGLKFPDYLEMMKLVSEKRADSALSDEEKHNLEMSKLNYQRSARILRTYEPGKDISGIMKNISQEQVWMVISEMWCGDSAQNLPYIYKIAELNPLVQLRIILRDSNSDIMDYYLTQSGARSIPKLVAFDEEGEELFQWGARPREAQELVLKLKSEGMEKEKFLEQLHLWYGRNRGKALENEMLLLLNDTLNLMHHESEDNLLIH